MSVGPTDDSSHHAAILREFERAAPLFAERTKNRFDGLGVVDFARARDGESVVEVGAGTGNFLALFAGSGRRLTAVDLTPGMLEQARARHPGIEPVVADGRKLPFKSRSVDLVASAQALHHIWDPMTVVKEMRRVVAPGGRVLIVDQVATERYEEAAVMTELETLRDPSHAVSRAPSAYRMIVGAAGLEIIDESLVEQRQRMSAWMWPAEFPEERIVRVRHFIERLGHETGMRFEREGDDWVFTRRRIMLLVRR